MTTAASRTDQPHRRRMTAPKYFNPFVRAMLRSPFHGIFSRKLMLITVRGRKTGRPRTFPVGYVEEGDVLFVLVGDFETKTWWRNVAGGVPMQLILRGRTVEATGDVLRWESDGEALTGALVPYLKAFPGARRALGITGRRDAPDSESIRAAAQRVVMVRARLAPTKTTKG